MNKTRIQIYRFAIIGVLNTALDASIYIGLTRLLPFFELHIQIAAFFSFLVAGLNSYYWNKRWTFEDKDKFSHQQLLMFYTMSGIALIVNEIALWFFVQFGIHDIIAKLSASVCAAGCNYFLQRKVVFSKVEKIAKNS